MLTNKTSSPSIHKVRFEYKVKVVTVIVGEVIRTETRLRHYNYDQKFVVQKEDNILQ